MITTEQEERQPNESIAHGPLADVPRYEMATAAVLVEPVIVSGRTG